VGHDRWLRNIAVALGNALASPLNEADRAEIRSALSAALERSSPLVQEHIDWALAQNPSDSPSSHNGPRKNEKRP
jgi:epoxyqueuosine reductase